MNKEHTGQIINKALTIFSSSMLGIALIWTLGNLSIESFDIIALVETGIMIARWIGGIALYLSLQFILAIVIGRSLRRSST